MIVIDVLICFYVVKDKVACDERPREPTFEKIRFLTRMILHVTMMFIRDFFTLYFLIRLICRLSVSFFFHKQSFE